MTTPDAASSGRGRIICLDPRAVVSPARYPPMGVAPLTTPADAAARAVCPRNAANAHQGGRDDVIIYDGGTNDDDASRCRGRSRRDVK